MISCSDSAEETSRNRSSIVLCTSLFGANDKYLEGALQCAREMQVLLSQFPRLVLVIYYDQTVPERVIKQLSQYSQVILVSVRTCWAGVGTVASMYRFLGFRDYQHTASIICTWDLDNRLNTPFFNGLMRLVNNGRAVFFF